MTAYTDFTPEQLYAERSTLEAEKDQLEKFWMVSDEDDEWDEVLKSLDLVNQAIRQVESEKQTL